MKDAKRVVVKIGTGVLTRDVGKLDAGRMKALCAQIARLRKAGKEVALVSSGAVGLGMGKLGLKSRPKQISTVQKCAAVGQGILIDTWSKLFEEHGITTAQLLLTKDDVDIKHRHDAMNALLDEILKDKIVPVINENDSVSASELNIKFGDNDVLSSLVATLIKADCLVILSTASGLLDMTGDGSMIKRVEKIDAKINAMASGTTSATAVGGMITKLRAAKIATGFGCGVYIASGSRENVLDEIFADKNPGTFFVPSKKKSSSKKRWLAYFGKTAGKLHIDEGAENALRNKGSSLLVAGVKDIEGNFKAGNLVEVVSQKTKSIMARGLAYISSDEMRPLIGKNLDGCDKKKHIAIHRDNLSMR